MTHERTPGGRAICFGEALIDFLAQPDAPQTFTAFAGGAPANVAAGVGRLSGDVAFAGMLSQDMFGEFLLQQLRDMGVDVSHVRRHATAPTALAFVALDADGERSFSFRRPPAADLEFRAEDFDPALFDGATVLHVCSNSLTETGIAEATMHGIAMARRAGALVSVDINFRPALWAADVDPLPRLWAMLAQADLVKLAANELEFLAGEGREETVFQRLWAGDAQAVVVTDGAAPVRWCLRDGRSDEVAPFQVRCVDSTAAGDAFVAGLLFQLAHHGVDAAGFKHFLEDASRLQKALRFAAATGALAVTRPGAFAAMPSLTEVQQLLERASHAA